jgi:acetoin utilization deacetylase AcuC-like enzyme
VNKQSWLQTVLDAYSPALNMVLCGFDAEESDSQFVFEVPMAWHLQKVRYVEHIQHNP